jgi:hypothetical protein
MGQQKAHGREVTFACCEVQRGLPARVHRIRVDMQRQELLDTKDVAVCGLRAKLPLITQEGHPGQKGIGLGNACSFERTWIVVGKGKSKHGEAG